MGVFWPLLRGYFLTISAEILAFIDKEIVSIDMFIERYR